MTDLFCAINTLRRVGNGALALDVFQTVEKIFPDLLLASKKCAEIKI